MPKRRSLGERLGADAILPPEQMEATTEGSQFEAKKLTIYITPEQKRKLRRLVRERQDQGQEAVSMAQIIREAIDHYGP